MSRLVSTRPSGSPPRRQSSRTSSPRPVAPSRPVSQWPSCQLALSCQTSARAGKAGNGRASQVQMLISSASIIRPGKHARGRVIGVVGPIGKERLDVAALDQIVGEGAREIRREGFRGFRVEEHVRLVRALVDRRAAGLGEADRLALGNPGRRRAALGPARPVEMRVRPPRPQILEAEDPRLAEPVADRRAVLRRAVGRAGIEPVEAFAALDVRAQIVEIVDRRRSRRAHRHDRRRRASPRAACNCRCR